MIYYYAYGSNLHPMRLVERVPSADLVGVAKHPNHMLTFHKKSNDGSSKCNMFNSDTESDLIYGAIYKLKPEHKNELDRFEGKGYGYIDNPITLEHNGNEYTCFTYLAQQSHIVDSLKPYCWYKQLVILGAKFLNFPDSYISSIEAVESMEDPEPTRRKEKDILIENIINYR
ncbi:MAG: gamma-glutamylcyclotransferase family protein [Thiogranum sp.]